MNRPSLSQMMFLLKPPEDLGIRESDATRDLLPA